MASESIFSPPSGLQATSSAPSEARRSDPVQQGTSYLGPLGLPYDEALHCEGMMKEEFRTEHCCFTGANDLRSTRYEHVAADNIPRSMSAKSDRPENFFEGPFSIYVEEEGSPHYTSEPSTFSRGPGFMPSPPSAGMSLLENRWEVTKHERKSREVVAEPTKLLISAEKVHMSFPSSLAEGDEATYQDALESAPRSMTRERILRPYVTPAAQTLMVHGIHNANESDNDELSQNLAQPMSELLVSTRQALSQHVSIGNIESLEDDSPSDAESGSGERWTGRYILEFLWDQWLNGIAIDNTAIEASDLAFEREAFIDRIKTTLSTFNPRWTPNLTSNTGSRSKPSTSNRTSISNKQSSNDANSSNHGRKRSWDDEDRPSADGNGGPPDNVGPSVRERHSRQLSFRLACPFRKHDPQKYNLHEYRYRVCATKPWDTISRLKQHLYTTHRAAIHCSRCKVVFESYKALELHTNVTRLESCERNDSPVPDGMTPAMEGDIKGRWQSSPPQVFWARIYQILFPNEDVPSPDFEPIPDTPPARDSAPPRVDGAFHPDIRGFGSGSEDEAVDDSAKLFFECVQSNLPDFLDDCRKKSVISCTRSEEARYDTLLAGNLNNWSPENSSIQNGTGHQPNWEAVDNHKSSPISGHSWIGQDAQIDASTSLPQASSTVAYQIQDPLIRSNPSICPCSGLCNCLTFTGSDPAMPKSDPHATDLLVQEYEAPWADGLTDVTVFNNPSPKTGD